MSSTILHKSVKATSPADEEKSPLLIALGERLKALRARRGMTRKSLALAADVSERHLANLEYGTGNASLLVLQQVAVALQCSLAELIGDVTTSTPEWLLLRGLLEHQDEATLQKVRLAVSELLGASRQGEGLSPHIALVGLRGAGKTTLGKLLAADLNCPFIELSREIEKLAGCNTSEIQALYGMNAYRRYERRALEEALRKRKKSVIAMPGGLISDTASLNLMLTHCTSVWLQADAKDHMKRVVAQGDTRPMAASKEAMQDLQGILAGRVPFYSKANFTLNTSAQSETATFKALRKLVREALGLPLKAG